MNGWLVAACVLTAAIAPCLGVAIRAQIADALVALELASTLAVSALMVLAEGLHRQPFIDLALVLALLSIVGAVAFARFLERFR
jgi:multisubunit Na+/H+ antiporter MnhF subunit